MCRGVLEYDSVPVNKATSATPANSKITGGGAPLGNETFPLWPTSIIAGFSALSRQGSYIRQVDCDSDPTCIMGDGGDLALL